MFNNRLKNWFLLPLLVIIAAVVFISGCGGDNTTPTPAPGNGTGLSGSINIIGSNTVTPLSTV